MSTYKIITGDCIKELCKMPENSVDSIVTDPPYEIGFMQAHWDKKGISFDPATWRECLRVLKPGGHLLSFGGPRTYHRMACAIEDAGFEIRDTIMFLHATGFPKSLNISKAIDKHFGETPRLIKEKKAGGVGFRSIIGKESIPSKVGEFEAVTVKAKAKAWKGWGSQLKPAHEPIILARKPLDGRIVDNVLKYGVGGINIDDCRVPLAGDDDADDFANNHAVTERLPAEYADRKLGMHNGGWMQRVGDAVIPTGRFPANVIHDGSDEVVSAFPNAKGQQGDLGVTGKPRLTKGIFGDMPPNVAHPKAIESDKSASRFFFSAKTTRKDRGEGNDHPTVKPFALMAYLCRLVTPPNGVVLDPFTGSGSTGKAALAEGFNFIGIEQEARYADIARNRIEAFLLEL